MNAVVHPRESSGPPVVSANFRIVQGAWLLAANMPAAAVLPSLTIPGDRSERERGVRTADGVVT